MVDQIKVELQAVYGTDRQVAESAWTSTTAYERSKQRSDEDVSRVIKYLAEHRHSTPFESVVTRWHIRMPIATDRQLMTHRIQSTSGLSGRYRTLPTEFLQMPADVKALAAKAELGSLEESYNGLCSQANSWYLSTLKAAKEAEVGGTLTNTEYKRLREFLRGTLPQHNMTERVSLFNLRSLANFIKLRASEHAQPEIRIVAKKMLTEVRKCDTIKVSVSALEAQNWSI